MPREGADQRGLQEEFGKKKQADEGGSCVVNVARKGRKKKGGEQSHVPPTSVSITRKRDVRKQYWGA